MHRVIVVAVAGLCLGGCSSSSSSFSWDSLKPTPKPVQVQLESTPPGADAVTSLGPGCKTPCSLSVAPPESGFSVTFNMPKFEPATIPVTVTHTPAETFAGAPTTTIDPNPVAAELKPVGPPPRKPGRPKKKKPAPGPAAEAPAAGSAFPDPNAAAPTQ